MTGRPPVTTADLRGRSVDVTVARQLLQEKLDAIVAQTRVDMHEEWQEWQEAGWIERYLWLKPANKVEGAAVGTWEWLSGTVQTVWQLAILLAETFEEVQTIKRLFLTGQWEALDQKIADYREQGEELVEAASEAMEMLILIFHDEPMRDMLFEFAEDWWEAIPPDERGEIEARYGAQIIIDVVIAVLLAAFSAGTAGVAYGSAKWTARIGRLGSRVVDFLDDLKDAFRRLAKALKLRNRGLAEIRQADEDGVIESVWRPYEDKLADPKPGTLPNKEAREWYLAQEADIPNRVDKTKPLKHQAKQAFELRNKTRTRARELMADRQLAEKLMREEPNLTWEKVVSKSEARGFSGDDLWNDIIKGSQKSRASVNQALGVKPPGS